jgi:hypothetical protein
VELFRRRAETSVLIGVGLAMARPRCCGCGRAFEEGRRGTMKFRTALAILAPGVLPAHLARRAMAFVGTGVLLAAVSPSLGESVANCTTLISDRVLVAIAKTRGGGGKLCVFCEPCGVNVLRNVSAASEHYYGWDWLATLRPRWFARWRRAVAGTPAPMLELASPTSPPAPPTTAASGCIESDLPRARQVRVCPNCRSLVPAWGDFCAGCGAPLGTKRPVAQTRMTQDSETGTAIG